MTGIQSEEADNFHKLTLELIHKYYRGLGCTVLTVEQIGHSTVEIGLPHA